MIKLRPNIKENIPKRRIRKLLDAHEPPDVLDFLARYGRTSEKKTQNFATMKTNFKLKRNVCKMKIVIMHKVGTLLSLILLRCSFSNWWEISYDIAKKNCSFQITYVRNVSWNEIFLSPHHQRCCDDKTCRVAKWILFKFNSFKLLHL